MRRIKKIVKDKNAEVVYKDYQSVKQNKAWWNNWAKSFGYSLEEVDKGKKIIVRNGKTGGAIKTLTKA